MKKHNTANSIPEYVNLGYTHTLPESFACRHEKLSDIETSLGLFTWRWGTPGRSGNIPPLHAILQPRHLGVHSLKVIFEWSLITSTRKMPANHVFWRLTHFYTHLLLLLQPSEQWLSIVNFNNDAKPPPK